MDSDSKMDAPTPIIFGPQNDERPDLSGRRYIHSLPLSATSFHLKSLSLTAYNLQLIPYSLQLIAISSSSYPYTHTRIRGRSRSRRHGGTHPRRSPPAPCS